KLPTGQARLTGFTLQAGRDEADRKQSPYQRKERSIIRGLLSEDMALGIKKQRIFSLKTASYSCSSFMALF
ncbi:MAG: hypothetical protein U9N47_06300, partial [Thermodesulfobacteriota bacterium]|nr:hypothetical protein [Thermodesulfobacteriota bacterium]